MRLTEEYIHGAFFLEKGAHGLLPCRFTEKQLADCYRVSELRELLARSSAGVTVELETDARWLELSMELTFFRPERQVSFTVYADGKHAGTVSLSTPREGPLTVRFTLPGGPCPVQIWLDPLSRFELTGLTLSPGASARPIPRREGLCVTFGDSITQGMEAFDPARPYPMQLARALNTELLNLGVCGGTYQPQMLPGFSGLRPSLITVLYGFNDRNLVPTRAQFEENVEGFLAGLASQFPGVPTYVILPTLSGVETNTDKFATLPEIRDIIREKAAAHPALTLLDGTSFMPYTQAFFRDAAHPTDRGFDVMTRCLLEQLC